MVNAKDTVGNTALHIASREGHLAMVKCLCELGADIKAKNINNETP